jgi:Ca2+-binding RTX toxin-like protein
MRMVITIPLDPNFDSKTVDLGALGYEDHDVVLFRIAGGYRDDGVGPDGHFQVTLTYRGLESDMGTGFTIESLSDGLALEFTNADISGGTNVDPNDDFRLVIKPTLFSYGNEIVDFNHPTEMQAIAMRHKGLLYIAFNGDDTVTLPDRGNFRKFDSSHYFEGNGGEDTIIGGNRNDLINGGENNDVLSGGQGKDNLHGIRGADRIDGGLGDDKLLGGRGDDELTGGGGADIFIYKAQDESRAGAGSSDTVVDFSQAEGDRVNLRSLFASFTGNADAHLHWIGKDDFSGTAGELHAVTENGKTRLEADLDGGGAADFVVLFEAAINFRGADLIL